MSQISQLKSLSSSLSLSVSPPASLTQLSLFLNNQTCWLRQMTTKQTVILLVTCSVIFYNNMAILLCITLPHLSLFTSSHSVTQTALSQQELHLYCYAPFTDKVMTEDVLLLLTVTQPFLRSKCF